MFEYKCKLVRVIDGDTVDIDIDLGFGVWLRKQRIRMYGIDTPESRTRDKEEKVFGLAAKERVKEFLPIGSMQVLKTEIDKSGEDKKGKFGRILGDFQVYYSAYDRWGTLTEALVKEGHAVPYHGQSKEDIQEAHMANRKRLIEGNVVTL